MVREGLFLLLKTLPGISLVGQAGNGEEALELIRDHAPDPAILDHSMPGFSGLQVIKALGSLSLQTRVIILTMHTEPGLAAQAMASGAAGYLLKNNAFEELSLAIETVMSGNPYISSFVCAQSTPLTRRETKVLTMIASGHTNREMAHILRISMKTVDTHRTHIMNKLDLHTTANLVRYAIKCGLIQPQTTYRIYWPS